MLFPAGFFPELKNLPEGKGGGFLVRKHPQAVLRVSVSDPLELADADTPDMLEKLKGLCQEE